MNGLIDLLGRGPKGRGLTVVGDDAQSIYSFRAATVRNILDFPAHFSPPAELITLEQNYRSTQPVLAAANAVIDLAIERFTKNLWSDRASMDLPALVNVADDNAQAGNIVENILANREAGMRLKSQAVLFRTSSHSATLEVELTRRNIPFVKFGGLKFLEAAHIKDVLAVLRWAHNLRDRAATTAVQPPVPAMVEVADFFFANPVRRWSSGAWGRVDHSCHRHARARRAATAALEPPVPSTLDVADFFLAIPVRATMELGRR